MYLISVGLNQTSFKGIYSNNDTLPRRTIKFSRPLILVTDNRMIMQCVRIRNCTGDVFCCKKAFFRVLYRKLKEARVLLHCLSFLHLTCIAFSQTCQEEKVIITRTAKRTEETSVSVF
ncbi:uncharacterized protein LOC131324141 [Rhododendron vialii]|uniref:uncharacterized protein LOC131324141 n=1 Tax=Rhododendron vialii TaxID=182163 RepID=UPI00265D76E0|nr:uncharacterized protein LOC131324141 [Rhododendron vialii]